MLEAEDLGGLGKEEAQRKLEKMVMSMDDTIITSDINWRGEPVFDESYGEGAQPPSSTEGSTPGAHDCENDEIEASEGSTSDPHDDEEAEAPEDSMSYMPDPSH